MSMAIAIPVRRRDALRVIGLAIGAVALAGCGAPSAGGSAAVTGTSPTTASAAPPTTTPVVRSTPAAPATVAVSSQLATITSAAAAAPGPTATPIERLAAAPGKKGKLSIGESGSAQEVAMRSAQIDAFQKAQQDRTVDFLEITGDRYQWMVDLMWKYHVAPQPSEQAQLSKVPAFQSGREAMTDGSASSIVVFNKEPSLHYDIVRIPQKATQRSGASTLTYGINSQSKVPDGAWEAIAFLCAGTEGQTFIAKATFAIPAVQNADIVQIFEQANPQPAHAQAFIEQAKSSELDVYPPSYQDAQTAWNKILNDVWANKKPVQQAMGEIDQQANALLKG